MIKYSVKIWKNLITADNNYHVTMISSVEYVTVYLAMFNFFSVKRTFYYTYVSLECCCTVQSSLIYTRHVPHYEWGPSLAAITRGLGARVTVCQSPALAGYPLPRGLFVFR